MQLVNGAQILNITFLLPLFWAVAVPMFMIITVPLTHMYASLWSHKLDLMIRVLNLMSLFAPYVTRYSSFV